MYLTIFGVDSTFLTFLPFGTPCRKTTAHDFLVRQAELWKKELSGTNSSRPYYSRQRQVNAATKEYWPCLALYGAPDSMSRLFHVKQGGKSDIFDSYGSPNKFHSLGAWLEGCGKGFSQYSREIITRSFMTSSGEILPSKMTVEEQLFLHKSWRR